MSKSNIQRVIEEILSDEKNLIEFFSCENQDTLYNYCMSKGTGYTREEFDEFIEETISKANLVNENEEINQNSSSDGGAKASFGKKIRQAFTKVLAAGLAVFSVAPVVQNLMPNTVQAIETAESINEKTDEKKILNKSFRNKIKNLSTAKKAGLGVGALGTIAAIGVGAAKVIPAILGGKSDTSSDHIQTIKEYTTCFLGSSGSGKTALIERITSGNFNSNTEETTSTEIIYHKDEVLGCHRIFDNGGQERFLSATNFYAKEAEFFVLTISLKDDEFQNQIDEIEEFFEIIEKNPKNAQGIVVMTKSDSVADKLEKTKMAAMEKIQEKINTRKFGEKIEIFPTPVSALDGAGVSELKNKINEKTSNLG